jgi:hypothetical protein
VLNHLGVASSIKDNVLAVSSTNRYRQKVSPASNANLTIVRNINIVQASRRRVIAPHFIKDRIVYIYRWTIGSIGNIAIAHMSLHTQFAK